MIPDRTTEGTDTREAGTRIEVGRLVGFNGLRAVVKEITSDGQVRIEVETTLPDGRQAGARLWAHRSQLGPAPALPEPSEEEAAAFRRLFGPKARR